MRKFLIIFFSITLLSVCAICVAKGNNQKPSVYNTYNTDIDGNHKITSNTRGYKCDLSTLRRDTLYYNNHHQFGDTINIYSICIKEYPEKANLYNNRGNVYKMLKEYDKALADYEKAIALDTGYLSPYSGKMSVYIMQSKFEEALKFSDKILKLEPKSANVYYQRGTIYFLKKDYDNALKNYNLAIKYDPKRIPSAYFYRGNVYFKKEDYNSAIKDYKKSIDCYRSAEKNNVALIDYSVGEVYYNLGIAYIRIEDYEKALGCLVVANKYYEAAGDKATQKAIEELIVNVYNYNKSIKKQ